MYGQQLAQFDAAENGLVFGRLDFRDGDRRYIGRLGLHRDSEDYEQLLMDWRAAAARPFYLATAVAPEDVLLRRHIETRDRKVIGLDDEVLDLASADPTRREGLAGESALLAAMSASRTGRMSDIVETIQAEQDRDHPGPAGRRPGRSGRPRYRQDGRGAAPRRLPALHPPAAAAEAGCARRRTEYHVPPLYRAGTAVTGRDQRAAVHHGGPVPGHHGHRFRVAASRGDQGRPADGARDRGGGAGPGAGARRGPGGDD